MSKIFRAPVLPASQTRFRSTFPKARLSPIDEDLKTAARTESAKYPVKRMYTKLSMTFSFSFDSEGSNYTVEAKVPRELGFPHAWIAVATTLKEYDLREPRMPPLAQIASRAREIAMIKIDVDRPLRPPMRKQSKVTAEEKCDSKGCEEYNSQPPKTEKPAYQSFDVTVSKPGEVEIRLYTSVLKEG